VKGIRAFRGQRIRGEVQVYLKVAMTTCTIYCIMSLKQSQDKLKSGGKDKKTAINIEKSKIKNGSWEGSDTITGFWVGRMHQHCNANEKLESQL
jgi:hypothetical protein